MSLGPIEVIVFAFPGNQFNGEIIPELARLVEAGTISIVDGLFATKDADGDTAFVEIDEIGDATTEVGALSRLFDRFDDLISDEDVMELTADLEPNSSAAILVFEHTWARALSKAVQDSGGYIAADMHVPNEVIEEIKVALDAL